MRQAGCKPGKGENMTFSELHIDKRARHEFWTERYREQRRREGRIALVCFLLVVALVMGLGMALDKPPAATWDGERWSCPAGYRATTDQDQADAGLDPDCTKDTSDDQDDLELGNADSEYAMK